MINISKEMEIMEMEHKIRITRRDLTGDLLSGAKLLKAAKEKNWQEVLMHLDNGADPRICRWGSVYGVESSLYYALLDKQFDIAGKLYDAGDRLDDLVTESEISLPWEILDFLSREMHYGRNYFLDETKTLSECCRCSSFEQIECLIPSASQDELNKSVPLTIRAWMRNFHNTDIYLEILKDLFAYGAKLPNANKVELLALIDSRFGKCPAILHPDKDDLEKMIQFIKNV